MIDSGLPLGVQCLYCFRRALIPKERLARLGEKSLRRLPLVCTCGSHDVKVYVLETPDEIDVFRETGGAIGTPRTGTWRPIF
ncbi:MAG: hypothetical protein WCP68_09730 [Enhydrobacter sp.]